MSGSRRFSFRRLAAGAAIVAGLAGGLSGFGASATSGTSSISGAAFQDTNRNGVQDAGEAAFSGKMIKLYDAGGVNVGSATTSTAGQYTFGGLADGTYRVQFGSTDWTAMRNDWTPTTTGSLLFKANVSLSGSARADFGLRPIVRSTTMGSPITSYVGANGLRVESYNDVVPATDLYAALMAGGLIGEEARATTVRLDLGGVTVCYYGASGSAGSYSNYSATLNVAWSYWLTSGDTELFHEYGHAWAMYYAHIAQQDTSLAGYLRARGIEGDARLGSSADWDPKEMIAEDYRQLFGSANAAAEPQANGDIPAAPQVAGLREYLSSTFRAPVANPAPSSAPAPAPAPSTAPAVVQNLSMNPDPVSKSGTASFTLAAPATVTVEIRDAAGVLVRTLLNAASKPAGTTSVVWDRKDAKGRRAPAGSYNLVVLSGSERPTLGFRVI